MGWCRYTWRWHCADLLLNVWRFPHSSQIAVKARKSLQKMKIHPPIYKPLLFDVCINSLKVLKILDVLWLEATIQQLHCSPGHPDCWLPCHWRQCAKDQIRASQYCSISSKRNWRVQWGPKAQDPNKQLAEHLPKQRTSFTVSFQ